MMKALKRVPIITMAVAFLLLVACVSRPEQKGETFRLSTDAVSGGPETGFDSGLVSIGRLNAVYAAEDGGAPNPRSFPFRWQGLPEGTQALAVVLDDPDAKPVLAAYGMEGDSFLHWIATDIDPSSGGLEDNAAASSGFSQGINGMGQAGYTGPQPPADVPAEREKPLIHVYRLRVYALSQPTGLPSGFSLEELMHAIDEITLGEAQINVSYSNS